MRVFLLLTLVYGAYCCPNGWIQHDASCYHFSHDLESWTGAAYMCGIMGGNLVEIETAAENSYLTTVIDRNKQNYCIGLSDVQEENIWMWMNSKVKLSTTAFSSWFPAEPNNNGGNENCGVIIHSSGGKWNDYACSHLSRYICESQSETEIVVG